MAGLLDKEFMRANPGRVWPRALAYTLFEGRPLTTRGQWINPVVLAGHRLWSVLPFSTADREPIFILGTGRSGTTVLGQILAAHPDVGYLNEPKALWQSALGNDDLIGSYSTQPGQFRIGPEDVGREARKRLIRSYRAFMTLSRSRRIVDKYPELIFRADLLRDVFPKARFLVLIRDGRAVCRSVTNWSAARESSDADWWGRDRRKWRILVDELVRTNAATEPKADIIAGFQRQEDMAATEWALTMHEALQLRHSHATGRYFIRYENLVARPAEEIEKVLKFSGLEKDDKLLGYAARTLRPAERQFDLQLHPAILPFFNDIQRQLGYPSAAP